MEHWLKQKHRSEVKIKIGTLSSCTINQTKLSQKTQIDKSGDATDAKN